MKIKKFLEKHKVVMAIFLLASVSLFLSTSDAYAVFDSLTNAGNKIKDGLTGLVPAAATIGIACVCIAGMFGNFNWKWLAAIAIGIFVMSVAAGISGSIEGSSFDATSAGISGSD